MFRLINLLIALLLASSVWAEDDSCNSSECQYRLTLDRAGAYVAVVTLPDGQQEGLWSLVINPSSSAPQYQHGFWAGSILKEQAEMPNWVGFSLSERESINVIPYDWTGNGLPVTVQINKDIGGGNRASVYGPTLMAPGKMYLTPPLEPGFYITELLSQPDSPRTYLGLSIEGNSFYGGVTGGWLDSYSGEGYAAFVIDSPTTMGFLLSFGDTVPGLGAGKPHLKIYYQYEDGTRELYWSAPSTLTELVHPQKGNAILFSSDAKQTWNKPTQFSGGVSVEDGDFVAHGTATDSQKILVKANIKVQSEYIGQNADLLLITGTEPQPAPFDEGTDTTYTAVNSSNSFYPLDWYIPADEQQPVEMTDDWQPDFIPAYKSSITLQDTVQVEFQSDKFTVPGMYYFHFAYRLENGDIIYSPMPIKLEVQAGEQPYFPGIVQIVGTNVDSVSLAWLPASDNKTPIDDINYEIHLSDQPDFEPTANTLYTSVVGVNQTDLAGLTTATTYNLLVVALDTDGYRSKERDYRTARTFTNPPVVSSTTAFAQDKQLGLGEATTQDGIVFTYPAATPGVQPEIGSVLFINTSKDAYIRKVDLVENTAQGLVVYTSDGELGEILETGTFDTQLTLFDARNTALRSSQARVRKSHPLSVESADNRYMVRWLDDFLVVEQIDYNEPHSNRVRQSSPVDVKTNVKFKPDFETKVDYGVLSGLNEAKIIAKGELKAEIKVLYNFKASDSVTKKFDLLRRTFQTKYLIGGVPVLQDTTLSVTAELSAEASAEIKAKAIAEVTATVKIGVEWNPETETWDNIAESDFKRSFTADISVHGKVVGKVRLIPNLEVKIYKSVTGNLSVEPFLTNTIEAETISNADILENWGYLKTQLTKFDVILQAEAYVSASVDIVKTFELLEKTKIWTSPKWVLFSLPELKLESASGKVNEPITLDATTTKDGENNPFDEGSIDWKVSPESGSVSGNKTGTFTASEEGTYTVFFSGHSRLPSPLGRQFIFTEVNVGP